MKTEVVKKVEFILSWYNLERVKFSFAKQIVLTKAWIDICTKNEEYEMADGLKKEKDKITKAYLKKKRESRTWKEKLRYYFFKLKRKFTK